MKKILCPSMMCANYANLGQEIRLLEEAKIDIFHLDVMDGNFVPNFGMGLQDIEFICKNSHKPCDVHLMINHPEHYIEKFIDLGCEIVYIHPEADIQACRTLQKIKDLGAHPGIAVNPGTSFESIKNLLYLCDYVIVMTVNPGFSGQHYLDFITPKFQEFVEHAPLYGGYHVMIDGACSPEKIKELSLIGVEGFILGTSALFHKNKPYSTIIDNLRKE
ncbi:ribulose-phosphate 3-epimerase [Clostridium sp. HCS.1]|uniref:ribulose-phosphate 3-epimerase n=1 Tax=Clostridium sp. HCS.1 TaxID=3238594 RepID=UPI003A0FEDCB